MTENAGRENDGPKITADRQTTVKCAIFKHTTL